MGLGISTGRHGQFLAPEPAAGEIAMSLKEVSAKQIILDVQAGLADDRIMKKYELSTAEYRNILRTLGETEVFSPLELEHRISSLNATHDGGEARNEPRCYLAFVLIAYDVSGRLCGEVQDLSERGCQVIDVKVEVGEKKTFRVEAEGLSEFIRPFSFAAECKWIRTVPETGSFVAGFEITNISIQNLEVLRKTIQLLTLCDRPAVFRAK